METTGVTAGTVTQGFGGAGEAEAEAQPVSDAPSIASDFETFLRMLTVQLENQDPLNPQKAEDFAVQLATFSNVEQAVYTNQLLEDLMGQMNLSGVANLAGWIGKEARADIPVQFDGQTPIEVFVSPDASAVRADLVVRDQRGTVVDRVPIKVNDEQVTWDGVTASGEVVGPGVYSFGVESFATETDLGARSSTEVYGRVLEARVDGGVAKLAFEGGGLVAADAVSALRDVQTNEDLPL